MIEHGWIVPGAFIDKRISLFQWFDQEPIRDGIKASRDRNTYTLLEGPRQGDKIYVEKGIITGYETNQKRA